MDSCNNLNKAPFDPGWNDPPTFSYNAQQTTSTRPRNFLNKRVAFPLTGTTTSSTSTGAPVNMPPLPSVPPMPIQPPPPLLNPTPVHNTEIVGSADSENALKDVKDILLKMLEDTSELQQKESDIKRRIGVMEEMWVSGKLNASIHMQMRDLVYALRDEQPSKADDIHRALMVDHVSAVGTWMPGVKQLIHSAIARAELLAIDKE